MRCAEKPCPAPRGAECHCAACHETFTSASAFDRHQTISDGLTCHDPGARGLVRRERRDTAVWGWPGDDRQWPGKPQGHENEPS